MSIIDQLLIKKHIDKSTLPTTGGHLTFNLAKKFAYDIFYDTWNDNNIMFICQNSFAGTDVGISMSKDYGKTWKKIIDKEGSFYRNKRGYGFLWKDDTLTRYSPNFDVLNTFTGMYHPLGVQNSVDEESMFASDKVMMYAEYGGTDGINGKRIWKSIDDGATWTVAHEDLSIGHWHSCQRDPYTDHWWACSGDSSDGVKIIRSTDSGNTWTVMATGSQEFRNVGFGFTENYIVWCPDYSMVPDGQNKLHRINKANIENDWNVSMETIATNIQGPSYGIIKAKDGRLCFWTCAENREQSCLYLTDGNQVKKILTTVRTPNTTVLASGFRLVSRPDYNNRVLVHTQTCEFNQSQCVYIATLPMGIDLQ